MEKNKVTRGVLNNNPGNIVRNSISWKGLRKNQTDKRFCQFSSIYYGVRALVILMHTYYYNYNLQTVEGIISRFAPSCENDTKSYIQYVKSVVYGLSHGKVNPDEPLEFTAVVWLVVPAITYYESHYTPTPSMLSRAYSVTLCPQC